MSKGLVTALAVGGALLVVGGVAYFVIRRRSGVGATLYRPPTTNDNQRPGVKGVVTSLIRVGGGIAINRLAQTETGGKVASEIQSGKKAWDEYVGL